MSHVTGVVAPVFTLIALGYLAGRLNWLSPASSKGLADFTFNLAIPALLFHKMTTTTLPDVTPYALWAGYFGTAVAVWLLAAAASVRIIQRTPMEAAAISMSAAFGNVVMIGMPIALGLYGEAAAAPVAILVALHSPLLWLMAAMHLAMAKQRTAASTLRIGRELAGELARELGRNVIILAIIAGMLWRLTGLSFDPLAETVITMLGSAGIPAALVSLGLSLVGFRIAGQVPTLTLILCLKLVVMPVLAWLMAFHVLGLPPMAVGVITIFAGMPTGANAYLFATRNDIAPRSASGAVALGTVIGAITATGIVYVVG